jgi:hypothetical protein
MRNSPDASKKKLSWKQKDNESQQIPLCSYPPISP